MHTVAEHRFSTFLGPISSLTTFGQTLILLNEQHVAFELLEKRSLSYSSRPRMVFSGEMFVSLSLNVT